MSFNVCPIATVNAPADKVWLLLSHPDTYGTWWEAHTDSIEPPGPAAPGQIIYASGRKLGRNWHMTFRIEAVDADRRQLDLFTRLPLGISLHNHISIVPLDEASSRLSFG